MKTIFKRDFPLLGIVFLVVILSGIRTLNNSETWTHLAGGKIISEEGIQALNFITCMPEDNSKIISSWLYDLIIYKMYSLTGVIGVTLFHVGIFVVSILLLFLVSRRWAGALSMAYGLLLVNCLIAVKFVPSPEIFCALLISLFLLAFTSIRSLKLLYLTVIPIQICWSNIHFSFIIGPILAFLFALQFQKESEEKGNGKICRWALPLILVIVSMIHPAGPEILIKGVREIWESAHPILPRWLSPFTERFGATLEKRIFEFSLFIIACGLFFYRERLPLALSGLTFLLAVGTFFVFKNLIVLFAVLAFPFFCLSFEAAGRFVSKKISGRGFGWAAGLLIFLSLLVGFSHISNAYFVLTGNPAQFGLGANFEVTPHDALEVVSNYDIESSVFNSPKDGGYIVLKNNSIRLNPERRVGFFGKDTYYSYYKFLVSRDTSELKNFLKEREINLAIFNLYEHSSTLMLNKFLVMGGWIPAYMDGSSMLLCRNVEKNKALIADQEIKIRGLELIEKARKKYHDQLGRFPLAPIPSSLVGATSAFLMLKQSKEAFQLLKILEAGGVHIENFYFNLGICALDTGKDKESLSYLKRAAQDNPDDIRTLIYLSKAYEENNLQAKAEETLQRASALDAEMIENFKNTLN